MATRNELGERLVKEKFLTAAQLETALDVQKSSGGTLGAILVKLGFISSEVSELFARWGRSTIAGPDDRFLPANEVERNGVEGRCRAALDSRRGDLYRPIPELEREMKLERGRHPEPADFRPLRASTPVVHVPPVVRIHRPSRTAIPAFEPSRELAEVALGLRGMRAGALPLDLARRLGVSSHAPIVELLLVLIALMAGSAFAALNLQETVGYMTAVRLLVFAWGSALTTFLCLSLAVGRKTTTELRVYGMVALRPSLTDRLRLWARCQVDQQTGGRPKRFDYPTALALDSSDANVTLLPRALYWAFCRALPTPLRDPIAWSLGIIGYWNRQDVGSAHAPGMSDEVDPERVRLALAERLWSVLAIAASKRGAWEPAQRLRVLERERGFAPDIAAALLKELSVSPVPGQALLDRFASEFIDWVDQRPDSELHSLRLHVDATGISMDCEPVRVLPQLR